MVVAIALVLQWVVVPAHAVLHLASSHHALAETAHRGEGHAHAHGHAHEHAASTDAPNPEPSDDASHPSEDHVDVLRVLATRTSAESRVTLVAAPVSRLAFDAPDRELLRDAFEIDGAPKPPPPRASSGRSPPSFV